MVDSGNVLHLMDEESSADGRVAFVPKLALKGLQPHQGRYREVHNHWKSVARAASINLISTEETGRLRSKASKKRIFLLDIRERKLEEESGEDKSVLADLGKWRVQIRLEFNDLFQPPKGVLPPGEHNFRIDMDPTGKVRYCQPYRMTQAERAEFEVQISKLLANGWVTNSH